MENELTPEQKFAAEDAETMVPRALMKGRSPEDVVAELVQQDWSPAAARAFVAEAADELRRFHESPAARQQLLRQARGQFVGGVLLTLLAIGLTTFTLLAAITGAIPSFFMAGGLFFAGVILLNRGWSRWRLYQKTELPSDQP